MSDPFIAEVRLFAGNFAPRTWAFCDGQLLPIAQNTALFSLIGTTYGGDGRTTTQLPDLRGRAAMHPGRGPGLTSRRLGQKGGVNRVTLTNAQVPDHGHELRASGEPANTSVAGPGSALASSDKRFGVLRDDEVMSSAAISTVGASQPHNNMQPYIGINFIICLQGIYPSF